ncbi:hypothetical protein JTE90_010495 [Oedothorax gibbosus]|uniref:Uncharacterized protein n=1 Tax=Oedothorax gibbosus TaxID=931172 RepID=A0AAV6W658_9ARAC|nr:hypothetical protein JTE90_010495 [Oedothorax gibbosus]
MTTGSKSVPALGSIRPSLKSHLRRSSSFLTGATDTNMNSINMDLNSFPTPEARENNFRFHRDSSHPRCTSGQGGLSQRPDRGLIVPAGVTWTFPRGPSSRCRRIHPPERPSHCRSHRDRQRSRPRSQRSRPRRRHQRERERMIRFTFD